MLDTPRSEQRPSPGTAAGSTTTPSKAPKRRLRPLLVAVVMLGAAALAGWWARNALVQPVSVVSPSRGTAAEVVYATGVVEPKVWAKVVSLQRKRIVDMCHCEGEAVKKGDVLARLDDVEERALLTELEARRKRLVEDAERMRGLVERSVTSRTTYDEKLTQIAEYDARISAQKDRIADLILRAPMDGIVLRRDGEIGEIAGTGANDVLFWVGQAKPLRVNADVNEEDILKVTLGQTVLLRHEGHAAAPLSATVADITPKGDPTSKTFRVWLSLPDDTPLRVGMTVEANIVVKEVENALLIPPAAIKDGSVFRIEDGRARKTSVETGVRGTRLVEVRRGLQDDARVIISPPAALQDGDRVRVDGSAGAP